MKGKYLLIMVVALLLTGCSAKRTAMNDLRHFTTQLQTHGNEYTVEDWKEAAVDFKNISDRISKHEYTAEEREEIGRMKGECLASFGKSVVNKITNAASELKGLFEGLIK